jgi:Zn finger protein HypA/HybF involved in hydrogenase expression
LTSDAAAEVAAQLVAGLRGQLPTDGFRLAGVEVQLGELVDLTAAELAAAIQAILGPVEVRVKVVTGVLKCLDCGAEYPSDEHPCPVCGSPNAQLVHGTELAIARAWGESG